MPFELNCRVGRSEELLQSSPQVLTEKTPNDGVWVGVDQW